MYPVQNPSVSPKFPGLTSEPLESNIQQEAATIIDATASPILHPSCYLLSTTPSIHLKNHAPHDDHGPITDSPEFAHTRRTHRSRSFRSYGGFGRRSIRVDRSVAILGWDLRILALARRVGSQEYSASFIHSLCTAPQFNILVINPTRWEDRFVPNCKTGRTTDSLC